MTRRALVTGGHGFIASHLARSLLERGDRVTVIDRARPAAGRSGLELQGIAGEVELIEADLAEPGRAAAALAARGQGFDSVFHLAAQTLVGPAMTDPIATFEANVAATWQLLEACRAGVVGAVIVASSDKAYGPSPELPYREPQALRPASPYEASKAAAEMIARAYADSYGLPLAVTRFANVFGGGDLNFSRLVPELIAAVIEGRRPRIRSDGSPERDYLYIDDAVAAYLAIERLIGAADPADPVVGGPEPTASAAGPRPFPVFNAGSGQPRSVRALIAALEEAIGQPIEPEYLGAGAPAGEIDRQWVDASRLTAASGWRAAVDLEEGLRRTYAWYAERPRLL